MGLVGFGTDGIRGRALSELTTEIAYALGRASAEVLESTRFIVGRDTRESGPLLSAALCRGMADAGATITDVGVLPTPGVAYLCADELVPGVVVSASHNPWADNGIKVLSAGGTKLTDADEAAIEQRLNEILDAGVELGDVEMGKLSDHDEASAGRYVDHLVATLGEGALAGLRVIVDCAHGAASPVAMEVLARLGAEATAIGCEPDGRNINDAVGSTHPDGLAAAVRASGAAFGLALDGDADRLVAVDERGTVVPGDALLVMFATDLADRGLLEGGIVVTVMSNLGLHLALKEAGIAVKEVGVGDRNVLHALDADGLFLGGEQSGHVIFRDRATTGDGLLTGILLADLIRRSGRPLSELSDEALDLVPQVLLAVPVQSTDIDGDAVIRDREAALSAGLGEAGRILLRASGTEPVVRVMVEATDPEVATALAEELAELVADRLGSTEGREAR